MEWCLNHIQFDWTRSNQFMFKTTWAFYLKQLQYHFDRTVSWNRVNSHSAPLSLDSVSCDFSERGGSQRHIRVCLKTNHSSEKFKSSELICSLIRSVSKRMHDSLMNTKRSQVWVTERHREKPCRATERESCRRAELEVHVSFIQSL